MGFLSLLFFFKCSYKAVCVCTGCELQCEERHCSWQTWLQVSVGRKAFFSGALGRRSHRKGNGCIWKCVQPPTAVLPEVDLSLEVHRPVWTWYLGTSYPQRSTYQLLIRLLLRGILWILFFQKLHVFLFQEVLVITRAVTHNEQLCYQLYRQPIPVKDLLLEDLQDGEVRLGGSLRGAFSNNERSMDGCPFWPVERLWSWWFGGNGRLVKREELWPWSQTAFQFSFITYWLCNLTQPLWALVSHLQSGDACIPTS